VDRLAPRPLAAAPLLVFAALALLPDGTVFDIGGTNFEAASGRSVVRGSYRWRRPRGFDLLDGQFVTVSARAGNARLSVNDAEATEGDDASLDFVVKLSPAASDTVTVAYATSDGTATAGSDYQTTSGELTFAPGETTMTISVPIIDDDVEDNGETVNLELSGASGADIGDGAAVGTIRNKEGTQTNASGALTAAFSDVPAEHDGSTSFTVRLAFSEELAPRSGRKVASALTLTGARRGYVTRVARGRDLYSFPVHPSGDGAVTLSLSASATDCAASSAVCTPDGRMLSAAVSAAVQGPPVLPVEDTEVDEGSPNILLYMADDMTWRDASTFGNAAVHTPTLDRLAEEGTTFTHVFTATAMCSPTRHMLYNGQYPVRSGAYPNHAKARLGTKSMVHYLRALGYRVGLAGKSHVAPDSVYRFERLAWGHPDLDAIRRFITRSTSQPFALIVASPQPHRPWRHGDASRYDPASLELPPNFVDTPETRDALSRYYAEITYLDDEFGSVLRILENNGVADDTLTMFYNEQGMAAPWSRRRCTKQASAGR